METESHLSFSAASGATHVFEFVYDIAELTWHPTFVSLIGDLKGKSTMFQLRKRTSLTG